MAWYGNAYHSAPLFQGTSRVSPTVSIHKLRNFQGEVTVFRVLEDGRVRLRNKIYSREEARSHYSYLLQRNWTKV
jgi:hypothetical protein